MERIALVTGIRTPFCKSGGVLRDMEPDDLGAWALSEMLARSEISLHLIDEVIFGNVLQPPHLANIARIVSVKAGLPVSVPAFTVNRNCASGLEAITTSFMKILQGYAQIIVAGGTESMSNTPILIKKRYREGLQRLMKAKGFSQKLVALSRFRFSDLIPEFPEISDPLCGLSMGQTAEILTREFKISRLEQDEFAFNSQQRAFQAVEAGRLAEEIVPLVVPPVYDKVQLQDDGIRPETSLEGLAKLKPSFDKLMGSVTAGNSSQITDGAASVLLMRESRAKELGLKPMGFILDYTYTGLQPSRMGLGPAFAIAKLLDKTQRRLKDFDLIEINEAFAGQVLAVKRALSSESFCQKELGRSSAIGEIDLEKLNVNGGAIALGHPLGASGTRLVLTILKELNRRNQHLGLVALCIGGGQGEAIALEVNP